MNCLSFFSSRFCRQHRLRTGENVPSIPQDLLLMSEMVLPHFILCIIQYLRDGYIEAGEDKHDSLLFMEIIYVGFLIILNKYCNYENDFHNPSIKSISYFLKYFLIFYI